MKRPFAWLTLFFCLGIAFSCLLRPAFWISFAACLVLVAACFFLFDSRKARVPLLCLCVCFAGLALGAGRALLSADDISRYASYDPRKQVSVRATVISAQKDMYGNTKYSLQADGIIIGTIERSCGGRLQAKLKDFEKPAEGIAAGDRVLLTGNLLPAPWDAGGGYRRGLAAPETKFICLPGGVRKLGHARQGWLVSLAGYLKAKFSAILRRALSSQGAAVMSAMLLGDSAGISAFIYKDMVRTGTVHVLVVSGTNVALVVFVCLILLKLLRVPRKLRFFFLFPAIVLYCLITGASPPVIRAGIMGSVFAVSYLLRREADIINSCCLAVLIMLAWDPQQLFDVSFQLSFASVLAIILLFPRLKVFFRADRLKLKFLIYICDSCLVSASAWLGTSFLLAWYFKMLSPVSILANLFVVPLAGLITLSGACLVISSWLVPCITRPCAVSCDHAIFLMVTLNTWFANLPFACFSWK